MDLHLKHRNGIVVEIAERNFHGNKKAICSSPPPILYNAFAATLRPPPSPFLFSIAEEKKRFACLFSLARDFDSHLIVPRLIRDRGFHYLSTTKLCLRIHRDNSSLRPMLSGERKLSTSKEYVRNNYSQNIQDAVADDENKIAMPSRRQPSMKVETWLVREVDGSPLSIPHVGHVGKCARNANRSISRIVFALFLFSVTFRPFLSLPFSFKTRSFLLMQYTDIFFAIVRHCNSASFMLHLSTSIL